MTRKQIGVFGMLFLCVAFVHAEEIAVKMSSGIKIRGTLESVSEDGIVLRWMGREKKLPWSDLHPETIYEIRRSRLDSSSAEDHIKLGDYCAENNLPDQAKKEYQAALKLDPTLRDKIEQAIGKIPEPSRGRSAPKKTKKHEPAPKVKAAAKAPGEKPAPPPKQMTQAELMVAGAELMKKMHEDPVKYYNEWIRLQKLHLKQVEEKLNFKFFTYETDHYIYHSTMSPAATKKISNGCEDLYKKMSKVFRIEKNDLLWAGKCIVHLFETEQQFIRFAVDIDGFDAGSARNVGGYFSHQGRFVHIAIPKTSRGKKGFEATLIHEGAHAFLQLFNEDVFIKPWIHEGVAQYFEHNCFPNEPEWAYKKATLRSNRLSLSDLRAAKSFIGMDAMTMNRYYSSSWGALDFMIRANPKKFVKFIRALKKGKTEEEAMKEGFHCSMREFELAWLDSIRKSR
ncbi:MAG: DUF1570 domain-containing protein [Planctomycetes bacterium]|nr:DUF1570 domain-containing protein [Planctomycetota bacterium]